MYETSIKDIISAQNGNSNAMQKILTENNGLIWSIVKRFSGRGYEIQDLYQIGCIGFIKAIKRFDVSFNVKISTYAVPYILGEIKRFIRDDGLIKVSRSIKELAIKINEVKKDYLNKNGKEITISEIAKILKVTKEEVAIAVDSGNQIESIYDDNEEDGISKIEKISNNKNEEEIIVNKISISNLIDELESREQQIIILRYFKENTQSEVANILGISQVQVSRIEKKVLSLMRKKLIA